MVQPARKATSANASKWIDLEILDRLPIIPPVDDRKYDEAESKAERQKSERPEQQ